MLLNYNNEITILYIVVDVGDTCFGAEGSGGGDEQKKLIK